MVHEDEALRIVTPQLWKTGSEQRKEAKSTAFAQRIARGRLANRGAGPQNRVRVSVGRDTSVAPGWRDSGSPPRPKRPAPDDAGRQPLSGQ